MRCSCWWGIIELELIVRLYAVFDQRGKAGGFKGGTEEKGREKVIGRRERRGRRGRDVGDVDGVCRVLVDTICNTGFSVRRNKRNRAVKDREADPKCFPPAMDDAAWMRQTRLRQVGLMNEQLISTMDGGDEHDGREESVGRECVCACVSA